ncbi:complex 1 protein-domain-containing protein [Cladorrhinum sp. PSN259]|nr:complex 1 protein-domain-containing protein [Cladorrhinum sp. PSN259]
MAATRLSGLQKEVLSLYRQCLRECRKKPEATRMHFRSFARNEFENNTAIDKRDFGAIEFLLRKGRRQLEMYASPGVKDIRK